MTPPLTRFTPPYRACSAGTFVASKYAHLLSHIQQQEDIVGISTVSRREHHTAQTREFTGLRVTEVAHDFQTQVTAYVKGKHDEKPELVNSYDTWHGNH